MTCFMQPIIAKPGFKRWGTGVWGWKFPNRVQAQNSDGAFRAKLPENTDEFLFMAALWNRAGYYIYLSCGFFFLLSSIFRFFLALSQPSQIGCLPYFHTWCGPSSSLGCCTRLAGNTGRKKSPKFRHLRSIAQLCRAISSQLRHISTIGKKLLNSNTSSTCPHSMVNFSPLTAEILFESLGHPS